jgi:hypothetical protein
MRTAIFAHLRGNIVGYTALFLALGGTSYAAVQLSPGSVTSRALARGAVTHTKLAANSVTGANVKAGTLTGSVFKSGTITNGAIRGPKGDQGPAGPAGPAGPGGGASVGARARFSGGVTGTHGAQTAVPLSGANTWTQAANELDLITGSMTVTVPSTCTGSFGNALIASVDGTPAAFATAPTAPAGATLTIPFIIGTLAEPGQAAQHTLTATFGNSCTKDGEDYGVKDVKVDVIKVP